MLFKLSKCWIGSSGGDYFCRARLSDKVWLMISSSLITDLELYVSYGPCWMPGKLPLI